MSETVKVIIKKPNEKAKVEIIKNDYETKREIIGGYVEYCYYDVIKENIAIIINEEGKLLELEKNFPIKEYNDRIVGNAIFVRVDKEDISDLQDDDIETILKWIEEQSKTVNNNFTKWLDIFIKEKQINENDFFTISNGGNIAQLQYRNILDLMRNNVEYQPKFKKELVLLDFNNRDIRDYLEHIAKLVYLT